MPSDTENKLQELLDSSLNYARAIAKLGMPVCPIPSGKKPPIPDFPTVATTDPEKIFRMFWDSVFEQPRQENIAIVMRGFVGIDVDDKEDRGGSESILRLELEGKELPETYTQYTPTGGRHYVYKVPTGVLVRNSTQRLAPGVDIRGAGGYLVGVGSVVTAGTYTSNFLLPAEAPAWLLEEIQSTSVVRDRIRPDIAQDIDEEYAAKLGESRVKQLPPTTQGSRDSAAYAHAAALREMGVNAIDAYCLLNEFWAPRCDPPFPSEELEAPVTHAYQYAKSTQGSGAIEGKFEAVEEELPTSTEGEEKSVLLKKVFALNKEYAFILLHGKAAVLHETFDAEGRPSHVPMDLESFHSYNASNRVKIITDEKVKLVPTTKAWLSHPARRTYKGMCFLPGLSAKEGYYNLFRGFTVEPKPRESVTQQARDSVDAFFEHMHDNICSKERDQAMWLTGWFAQLFQVPYEKPSVALVMRGKKGVGKSALLERIGHLLGHHFLMTAKKRFITGNFNLHLEKLLLFTLEEAVWAGDKSDESVIKDLISGGNHLIERKNFEAYTSKNCTRIAFLSNAEWVVPATADERRFGVFDVGDGRIQDRKFFQEMRCGMEAGGYSYLLQRLLDFDLSTVDVNAAPDTEGLLQQKIVGAEPLLEWWNECLSEGEFPDSGFTEGWPTEIGRNDFRDCFYSWHRRRRYTSRLPNEVHFGRQIAECLPKLEIGRDPKTKRRFYRLPSLDECRRSFEQRLGRAIKWEE